MIYPENRREFTVKELARACGSSRSSLIRMEEEGFLKPYRINPETNYRYYDADNAAQVGQYQMLQALGLTRREMVDYYYGRIDRKAFLAEQRERLDRMQRRLEEMEILEEKPKEPVFSFVDLPELTCWCATMTVSSVMESATLTYDAYGQCIEEGYRIIGSEPLFAMRSNEGRDMSLPYELTACIPVMPPKSPDAKLMHFPATRAFSLLISGDYSIISSIYPRFWQEVETRGIKPTGRLRSIALVAAYSGEHIKPENYVYRIVVPVGDT